jgi:putative ABC transport system permease protein
VLDRFARFLSGSSILLRAGGGQSRGGAHEGGTTTTLTLQDIAAVQAAVPAVTVADPMISTARDVGYGGRSSRVQIEGHSQDAELAWNRPATRGAYFTKSEVDEAARVALLGETVVRDLFEGRDPVGEQIRIGTVPFRVIGVLDRAGLDPHGIDRDAAILIPVTTIMRRVLNVDYITNAKLLVAPDADLDNAVLEVGDVLRQRHAIGPADYDDFAMFTPVQVTEMVKSTNRVFTLFLPLVAAVSILVGGLVVANLMLMNVNERRTEIGLRMAVGARARDIRTQFLIESAAVTGLGGVLALAVGYGILRFIAMHRGSASTMPWSTALLGLGVALAVGILSGVMPARRAAALDPVRTLQ